MEKEKKIFDVYFSIFMFLVMLLFGKWFATFGAVRHSIRYKIGVCVLTWRLDHFHINAKWLSIFTWNILLSISFCSHFMLSIAEPCFDLAIKRIIYHFWKYHSFFFKKKNNKQIEKLNFWQAYITSLFMSTNAILTKSFYV